MSNILKERMDNITLGGYIFRVALAMAWGVFIGWMYL